MSIFRQYFHLSNIFVFLTYDYLVRETPSTLSRVTFFNVHWKRNFWISARPRDILYILYSQCISPNINQLCILALDVFVISCLVIMEIQLFSNTSFFFVFPLSTWLSQLEWSLVNVSNRWKIQKNCGYKPADAIWRRITQWCWSHELVFN